MYQLHFTTKVDTNGNTLNISVDVENKLYARNKYWSNSDFVVVGKKDYHKLIQQLVLAGFKEEE